MHSSNQPPQTTNTSTSANSANNPNQPSAASTPNNGVASATTAPAKKKKRKKAPKERKPRPKPGEIRLTTALDGSTLFCCPECQMAYPERGLLEQHLVGHNLERRFICDICNAALKRKDHLTRHKQSHNPERPFVCTICLKAFKRKEQLTLHFVIHSGVKRHQCNECGKGRQLIMSLWADPSSILMFLFFVCRILSEGSFAQTHPIAHCTSRQSRTQSTESITESDCRPTITESTAASAATATQCNAINSNLGNHLPCNIGQSGAHSECLRFSRFSFQIKKE